jgi:predicted PurR-regulated permease PerM
MTTAPDPVDDGRRPDDIHPVARHPRESSSEGVPTALVVAAAWSWRLIVVGAAVAAVLSLVRLVSAVVVPLAVAVLLTALLAPAVGFLTRHTPLRQQSSAIVVLALTLVLVTSLLVLAGAQIATGTNDVLGSAQEGVDQVLRWLRDGPLHLSNDQVDEYLTRVGDQFRGASSSWTSGLLSAGSSVGHILAGLFICLIATFFFLAQGQSIWRFFVRMLPRAAQEVTYQAFRRGWVSLGHYARTQVLVAGVDAVGIGAGALGLRLPFVLPLTVLVFLSSFVPIAGAIFSGAVAVLIALVTHGPVSALVMVAVVLAVQQLETHVLQPFLMGRAVALHPLAVIAAVASGSFLLGIVGALFAVPALALTNSVVRYYKGDDTVPSLGTEPMHRTRAPWSARPAPGADQLAPRTDPRTGAQDNGSAAEVSSGDEGGTPPPGAVPFT